MATSSNHSRITTQVADQKLIDGFNKHAPTLASLVIGTATLKAADIIGVLQARIATANAVQPARSAWQGAVKADKDERARTKAYVDGVRQALQVVLSGSIEGLADFGLKARKARVQTPEKKAIAAAKAKATRDARGTKGSVQKQAVKGDVAVALVVTPADAPKPATAPTPVQATPPAPAAGTTAHTS